MQLTQNVLRPRASAFNDGRETTSDVVRIGIQIRAGDWTFDEKEEQELKFAPYAPFFDCARQIEGFAKVTPDTPVVWYLVSDSARVRKKALKRFGQDKLVTLTREHKHVACNVVDCARFNQTQALVDAVGDILSLAQTDYQVLTQKSGFGKVAASLAIDHWHNVYWPGALIWGVRHRVGLLTCLLVESTRVHMHACTDRPIGKGSFHDGKNPRKIVSTVGNCTHADYLLLEDLSDG